MAHRPAPPPPSRGHSSVVKALYPYTAQRNDELSFSEGDMLFIIEKNDSGWWKARVGNKTGLIPGNYVNEENTESIDNPLHEAAKRGNLGFLQECLANNVSVNGLDKSGSTALHWAAAGGHIDCVNELLNVRNISLNAQNKLGDTALHNGSWKGHAEVVAALLQRGADKNIKNNEKKTPGMLARNPEVQKLLQDRKADEGDYGADDDEDDE